MTQTNVIYMFSYMKRLRPSSRCRVSSAHWCLEDSQGPSPVSHLLASARGRSSVTLARGRALRTETLARKSDATGDIFFYQIVPPFRLLGYEDRSEEMSASPGGLFTLSI